MARRPGPSLRALLFRCGEGAVCEPSRLEDRQLRELVFLSVQKATLGTGGRGPQARSVLQGPAGPVRPSGPCCFGVAKAPFVSLRGWKTDSSES